MNRLRKIFTETDMTWRRVLIFSILCGVIVGVLMTPDCLERTSFRQPGISFEYWIAAALYIILNCRKPLEAGVKTFVFFLISQPLIYLVQVPFSWMHWSLFTYYPRWGLLTILTFPGAMLAWYLKKGNGWSVLLLGAADVILCSQLAIFVRDMAAAFPRYLLAVLFIVAQIVFFPFLLLKKRSLRWTALLIALLLFVGFAWHEMRGSRTMEFKTELDGTAPFEILSDYEDVTIRTDGNTLTVRVSYYCSCPIEVRDADGNVTVLHFVYGENGVSWERET